MNTKTGFVSKLPLLIRGMNAGVDDETVIKWLLESFGRANEKRIIVSCKKIRVHIWTNAYELRNCTGNMGRVQY